MKQLLLIFSVLSLTIVSADAQKINICHGRMAAI